MKSKITKVEETPVSDIRRMGQEMGISDEKIDMGQIFVNTMNETIKRVHIYAEKHNIDGRTVLNLFESWDETSAELGGWPTPGSEGFSEVGSLYDKEYD